MPGKHSTDVSKKSHREMMESADARATRREEQLARIPAGIGMVIRGRSRDVEPANLTGPYAIDRATIVAAGKRLQWRGIALNQFTENIPVLPDSRSYQQYVSGGNRHNRRHETDPEQREQARLARQRQTQHVADRLHREVWSELQLAQLFAAGMRRIKEDVHLKKALEPSHVHIAAAAIEDYGYSLLESENYKLITRGGFIANNIIHIGQHAVDEPQTLRAQPSELFLLVQREQERRTQHWGDLLDLYEQPIYDGWGGYRRTTQDEQDELANQAVIAQLFSGGSSVE